MYGAIWGDLIGSRFEFSRRPCKTKDFELLTEESCFTDDTVMTLAVGEALMDLPPAAEDETVRRAVAASLRRFGRLFPEAGYGGSFRRWLRSGEPRPYGSWGNGSAMRVSAAGWLGQDLGAVRRLARLTAEPTHNHPEGVKGAEAVAAAVFLARSGAGKEEIRRYTEESFGYDLSRSLAEIRPGYSFDVSCAGSVPEAIRAFLESVSFEDAIRNAVSLGGDTDTQGAMAGSIAEAFYGLEEVRRAELRFRLPAELRAVLERWESLIYGAGESC